MKIQNIGKEYLSCFFKCILSIFTAVSIIAVSTIIALYLKFIYKLIIYKYNLIDITGVSAENLMKATPTAHGGRVVKGKAQTSVSVGLGSPCSHLLLTSGPPGRVWFPPFI